MNTPTIRKAAVQGIAIAATVAIAVAAAIACTVFSACAAQPAQIDAAPAAAEPQESAALSPDDPVVLTMWHVYGENSDSPMNRLVDEFNATVGRQQGIVISVETVSNSAQIGKLLVAAQSGGPGAPEMPDLFFAHATNIDQLGAAGFLDWSQILDAAEIGAFMDGFLSDGMVDGGLYVLPITKSTHVLYVNGTRFDEFAAATGADYADLSTWEGLFEVAAAYREWTGGQTLCSFDYLMRCVELDALGRGAEGAFYDDGGWYNTSYEPLRESWLRFARPLCEGSITVSNPFCTTQMMTGETIAGVGSSASILYFNDAVTYPDNTVEPLDLRVLPLPAPSGGRTLMTQAGVGLCAATDTPRETAAAAAFARWLLEPERNLAFAVETGYLPATEGALARIAETEFADPAHERLYAALLQSRTAYTWVPEPTPRGYYGILYSFYDALRLVQPQITAQVEAGRDVDSAALETWELLCSAE